MDVGSLLTGRVHADVDSDDLVIDAVVVLRVAPPAGDQSAIVTACTGGTDGVVQLGLLTAAADIARNEWARQDRDRD